MQTTATELWSSNRLRLHHGNAMRIGDAIYFSSGGKGSQAILSAVDARSGKILWQERSIEKGDVRLGRSKADHPRSGRQPDDRVSQWFVIRGSWFVVRGSWFVVRGSWFVVRMLSAEAIARSWRLELAAGSRPLHLKFSTSIRSSVRTSRPHSSVRPSGDTSRPCPECRGSYGTGVTFPCNKAEEFDSELRPGEWREDRDRARLSGRW